MVLGFSDLSYTLPFVLTILIITLKFTLGIYLAKLVGKKKQEEGSIKLDFMLGVCILMFCAGISRTFYFIFDFFLTHFDPNLFYLAPNIYFWKIATFIGGIGMGFVVYIIDKQVYKFKLKGILAYILFISAIIQLAYPVNNAQDFTVVSNIGIIGTVIGLIFPLTFLYLGIKSSGELRKVSFLIAFSIIIYGIASQIISEPFLLAIENATGYGGRIAVIILFPILKMIGLIGMAYGVTKFKIK